MFHRSGIALAITVVAGTLGLSQAYADNGTWTLLSAGSASGTWSDTAASNWAGGTVADGEGFTADFSTLNITSSSTINLGSSRTIGNLIFGDTDLTTAGANWVLGNNNNPSYILTLAGTAPTITTNTMSTNALVTISAAIAGTNGLRKEGPAILSLSGGSSYSGGTLINTGSIRAGHNTALGTGAVTVASGAGLQLTNSISMSNAITLNGTTSLTLTGGANTLSGSVSLGSASTIVMGSAANASIEISGGLSVGANQLTLSGSRPLTLSGAISGSGTLNLSNIGGTTIITHDNSLTYSGQVKIVRSTLAIGHDGAAGSGTIVLGVNDQASGIRSTDTNARTLANVFALSGSANSTYNFGSSTSAVNGNLSFSNTSDISLGDVTKKFQVYNQTTFAAGLTGSVGLILQTGTGTLVLNGANTYTGITTVNAGKLVINGSTAGGAVNIAAAGAIGGAGTIGGVTNVAGTLAPGSSAGSLKIDNSLSLTGVAEFELGATASDKVQVNTVTNAAGKTLVFGGTLNVTSLAIDAPSYADGQVYDLFDWGSQTAVSGEFANISLPSLPQGLEWRNYGTAQSPSNFDYASGQIQVVLVPEPATIGLMGLAGAAVMAMRRRRA